MGVTPLPDDLSSETLAAELGSRPVRSYPAVLSTHADALAWARSEGPSGAVVVADYQASARGHGGLEWEVHPGADLGFSMVCRPGLPGEREGWVDVAALLGMADALEAPALEWPDLVTADGQRVAALTVEAASDAIGLLWAVVTVLVPAAAPDRARTLARAAKAIEARLAEPVDAVREAYRQRCATLGREVRAHLVPMGPNGTVVCGEAVDVRDDGSLVIRDEEQRRVAVPPRSLGIIETPSQSG